MKDFTYGQILIIFLFGLAMFGAGRMDNTDIKKYWKRRDEDGI